MRLRLAISLLLLAALPAAAQAAPRVKVAGVTVEARVKWDETRTESRPGSGVVNVKYSNIVPATLTALCPSGSQAVSAGFRPYQPAVFMPVTVNGRSGWRAVFAETSPVTVKLKAVCFGASSGASSKVTVRRDVTKVPLIDYRHEFANRCRTGVPTGFGWKHEYPDELRLGAFSVWHKQNRVTADFYSPFIENARVEHFVSCLQARGIPAAGIVFDSKTVVFKGTGGFMGPRDASVGCRRGTIPFGPPGFSIIRGVNQSGDQNLADPYAASWWVSRRRGEVTITPIHSPRPEFGEKPHSVRLRQPCLVIRGARVTVRGL